LQACIDVALYRPSWHRRNSTLEVFGLEGSRECATAWLPGSNAVIESDYVLGINCVCNGASLVQWPILTGQGTGVGLACRDLRLTLYAQVRSHLFALCPQTNGNVLQRVDVDAS
jgi:hypothetical protein